MPINSAQLATLSNLNTDQLSEILVNSGGPGVTFVSAKFIEVTNPSLQAYTFSYNAYQNAVDFNIVLVTYDSSTHTTTATMA